MEMSLEITKAVTAKYLENFFDALKTGKNGKSYIHFPRNRHFKKPCPAILKFSKPNITLSLMLCLQKML